MSKILMKFAAVVLLLGCALSLQAQNVSGTVKDAGGEPVIGAFVQVQGTTTGTMTDIDGKYSIDVPDFAKSVLEFSMMGMVTQTIPVNKKAIIDVTLTDDNNYLDEVVVVGYAAVKRRDLLGSVTSVGGDKLTEQPVTTVSQALAGKMAGVSVTTTEGDPDADIKIRVRGGGSITQDNSPLYIVDGFPMDNINDISASEIQSIDVLKDAFSTAIYGSRGANGVVIVTTKGGDKSQKWSVNFNTYAGAKYMANKSAIKTLGVQDFVKLQYEAGVLRDDLDDYYVPYFGNFSDIDLYSGIKGNDWIDAVFGNTGSIFNLDFSVSGNGENHKWTLGYAHMGDNAIMTASNYIRDNLHFKGNFKLSKKISFDINARYSRTVVNGAGANGVKDTGTTSGNGRLKHAVCYSPIPLTSTISGEDEDDYGDNAPPLQSVADNDQRKIRSVWNANAAFNWEIVDNLKLKVEGGLEDYRESSDRFYGMTTYYVYNSNLPGPANMHNEVFRTKIRNTNTLNFDFKDAIQNSDHNLNAMIGQELTITKSNTLSNEVINFPAFYTAQNAWNFMSSGTSKTANNYYNPDDILLSFFGRVNYDFKHRYSIGASLRADGSSKFAAGNRWGFFPSIGASWNIANENWMKASQKWLTQLKLRYSYGAAGNNNIPSGQLAKSYSANSTANPDMLSVGDGNTYWMSGKIMNNPDLKWETTYTHNIGLDFGFWQNKFTGSVEVYQNDTKDLLILFPIPGSGYESQYKNIGSTRNRGVELTLNAPVVQKENFSLNITGNISYNKNLVTDLGGLSSITSQSYWASTEIGDDYIVQVGQPLGNIYGYEVAGRYEVNDFNYTGGKWVLKDGVVDCSGITKPFGGLRPGSMKLKSTDKKVIGNALPKIQGGFALSGYVYGFDFSANFNYVLGNQIYNANKIEFSTYRKWHNRNLSTDASLSNRWTDIDWSTGQLINDPTALASANAGTTMWSPMSQQAVLTDWAVEDGSFLRLQSATIGYTLPEKVSRKIAMRKLRVYVTGTNLFCLTNYSGYDPEVDTRRATPLTPGVDYSAYPKSIGWVAGLNITF